MKTQKTILLRPILMVLMLLVTVVMPLANVNALPGGVGFQRGYFSNVSTPSSGFGAVISSCTGGAIADSSMTNKATFISRILTYYNGCGSSPYNQTRNSIGGKFIIQSMRGSRSSTVGTAEINDWKARINNPAITISWVSGAYFPVNSGYTGSMGIGNDDAFYNADGYHDSLVFKDGSGTIVYMLKSNCGNPNGTLSLPTAIIPPNWTISVSASVSSPSVTPGNSINWTHVVRNNGPNATDSVVSYHFNNSAGFSNTWAGGNGTMASGTAINGSRTFYSSYTPTFSDVGKTFCRTTSASPRARGDNNVVTSSQACSSVVAPINACRPIKIPVPKATTYPAVSLTDGGGRHYTPPTTVPITVSTSRQTWGPFTLATTVDATLNHTTGDTYSVTYNETTRHVSSYTTVTRTVYDYGWISHSSTSCSGTPPSCTTRTWKTWGIVGSHQVYDHTNTNYSGPNSWSGSSIGPCFDYILTSSMNNFGSKRESDEVISLNPTVYSSSYTQAFYSSFYSTYRTHTKSKSSKWQITMLAISPNNPYPSSVASGNSSLDPCSYFFPSYGSACSAVTTGTSVFSTSGNPSPGTGYNFTIPDRLAGSKICFAFSLYPNQSDPLNTSFSWGGSDIWNHAAFNASSNCIIVIKKPKVQVWGGDILSKNSVSSSTSVKNISGMHTFGSWVEYGVFAANSISGIASGSAFAGTGGISGINPICSFSPLTFTNANSSVCSPSTPKGYYTSAHTLPDVEASFPGGTTIGSSVTADSLTAASNNVFIGTRTGNLTLNASNLSPNKSVVLKVNGTVTIVGDQINNPNNNGAGYKDILQLPQLVVIADNIIINNTVRNVDAWLVTRSASGVIQTCDDVSTPTINTCNNPLRINGPVITSRLRLLRTAGSGTGVNSSDPAEVINLRADAYLWGAAHAVTYGRAQTVQVTELPPRY